MLAQELILEKGGHELDDVFYCFEAYAELLSGRERLQEDIETARSTLV